MRNYAPGAAAAIALLFAILIAAWGMAPPPVRPADAASSGVRVDRMLDDLRVISREPHVTGSAANARVRDHLVGQLQAMGLDPTIQRGTGMRQSARGNRAIAIAPVENVVAVLPGRDRSQPAVAVMAHYDSVPFSHGAGDDGAGVTSVLETARTIAGGPVPARDVVFLLTDGEELGLLGAQLFFTEHPLARRIGVVVNAEARGAKGRATMFQTSAGDRGLVALWADHAISPSGNSLAGTIYRLLPNDTDLSVPLALGIAGINAAFTGGHFDYHSTTDRFEHVDRRSLQHLGDFTLTTTRALAMVDALPGRDTDSVYFDVLGTRVVQYPTWLGWLLIALAGVGWTILYRGDNAVRPWPVVRGLLLTLLLTAGIAAVAHAIGMWLTGTGATSFREMMAEEERLLPVLGLIVLGGFLWLRPTRALALGAIALLILVALATQIWLPTGAFLFLWPALAAILLAAMNRRRGSGLVLFVPMVLLSATTLGLVLQLTATAWVSVGLLSAGVVALALPFMVALVGPLRTAAAPGEPDFDQRLTRPASALAIAGGLAGVATLALSDGFSDRQPRPGDFFALFDIVGDRQYWATTSGATMLPDGRSLPFANEAFPRFRPMTVPADTDAAIDPARLPTITSSESADGRRQIDIRTSGPPRVLAIAFKVAADARDTRVNGRPVTVNADGWTTIQYRAQQPANIVIDTRSSAAQPLAGHYLLATPGLPDDAPRPAGLATNWTNFTGTHVAIGRWPVPVP